MNLEPATDPHTITVDKFTVLWDAVQAECEKLRKSHPSGGGTSRGQAYAGGDEHTVATTLKVYLDDGTTALYWVEARARSKALLGAGAIDMTVERWSNNNEKYWDVQVQEDLANPNRGVVIEGVHYARGKNENEPGGLGNGFGGRRHVIEYLDGRVIECYDLWYQGPIPPAYRHLLPDNAKWGA